MLGVSSLPALFYVAPKTGRFLYPSLKDHLKRFIVLHGWGWILKLNVKGTYEAGIERRKPVNAFLEI